MIQADCQALFGRYSREFSHFSECVNNSFDNSKNALFHVCVQQYSLVSSMRKLKMPKKFTFLGQIVALSLYQH